jgi:hypothetical protein
VTLAVTPRRARLAVWLAVGLVYVVVGSLAPFVLLLGWWEAVPAVVLAIWLGDRAERRARARLGTGADGGGA